MTTVTEPLYVSLATRLRRDIAAGRIVRKLPSEKELVETHGINRTTVRRAIDELIGEGLVVSHNGRGHFIRRSEPLVWLASEPERNTSTDDDGPHDTWSRCVREQGREPDEDILTEIVYSDETVAKHMRIDVGVPMLARRRFRRVDGEPSSTADSFYVRQHVAGTRVELPGQVLPGVYAVFAEIGRPWARTTDQVISRAPTREETHSLRIPRGVPVTEVIRISYTADGTPVRVTPFILPGDRHIVQYDLGGDPQ